MAHTSGAIWRHPLHIHGTVLFSTLVLVSGAMLAWLGYEGSRRVALAAVDTMFDGIARETGSRLGRTLAPGARAVDLLTQHPVTAARSFEQRMGALPALRLAIEEEAFAAVYVGYADGAFFLLRPLSDAAARQRFEAPDGAAFLVEASDAGMDAPGAWLVFLDGQLGEIVRRLRVGEAFDPRTRPWYRDAVASNRRVLTAPYRFVATGETGITMARLAPSGSVVGLDVSLDAVTDLLARWRPSPGAKAVLFDGEQRVLAATVENPAHLQQPEGQGVLPRLDALPLLALATLTAVGDGAVGPSRIEAEGRTWQRVVLAIPTAREALSLGLAIPLDELLADARAIRDRTLLAALGVLLIALPLTYSLARRVSRPLGKLAAQANEIRAFHFDGPSIGRSPILEIDQLSDAMDRMRATIRRFLDIATSLNAERRFATLLERVASGTARSVGASSGVVYLLDADHRQLARAARVGGPLQPEDPGGSSSAAASAGRSPGVRDEEPIGLDDAGPVAEAFAASRTVMATLRPADGMPAFPPGKEGSDADTLIAIPLANREGTGLGVLALQLSGAAPPSPAQLAFAEALSGTAAVAIETQRLLEERKALLESFIRLLAGAIDARSPYTGGHCQRVPELTAMLAQAACDTQEGPLAGFSLDDGQWEALQIARWLHDCGKVTTPEYVVDKATKLETIHDRLHEVRTRFEVLKRDAEIDAWRRIADGEPRAQALACMVAEHATLDGEFAFVAACNPGGEVLDAAKVRGLHEIARRTWMRTLDDRIGISQEERQRKECTPAAACARGPAGGRHLPDLLGRAGCRPARSLRAEAVSCRCRRRDVSPPQRAQPTWCATGPSPVTTRLARQVSRNRR